MARYPITPKKLVGPAKSNPSSGGPPKTGSNPATSGKVAASKRVGTPRVTTQPVAKPSAGRTGKVASHVTRQGSKGATRHTIPTVKGGGRSGGAGGGVK